MSDIVKDKNSDIIEQLKNKGVDVTIPLKDIPGFEKPPSLDELNQEELLIYYVLSYPAGFDIDIAGLLWARRYEYPEWAVEWEEEDKHGNKNIKVKEFKYPASAAVFFVKKRHELELGLDFLEIDSNTGLVKHE
jgi:hypothetical protein